MAFLKSQGCIHIWYAHKAYLLTISLTCNTAMCFWRWPKSAITKYATSPVLCNPKSPMLPASPEKFGTTPTLLPGENWWIFQERWGIFPIGYLSSFVVYQRVSTPRFLTSFQNATHSMVRQATQRSTMLWTQKMAPKKLGEKCVWKTEPQKEMTPTVSRIWRILKYEDWRCGDILGESQERKWLDVCSFPMLSLQPRSFKFAYVFLAGIWNTNLLQQVSGQNNPPGLEISKKAYLHNPHPHHPSNPSGTPISSKPLRVRRSAKEIDLIREHVSPRGSVDHAWKWRRIEYQEQPIFRRPPRTTA